MNNITIRIIRNYNIIFEQAGKHIRRVLPVSNRDHKETVQSIMDSFGNTLVEIQVLSVEYQYL